MEILLKATVICVVASLMALVLKRNTPELALLLILSVVVTVMTGAFSLYREIRILWEKLLEHTSLDAQLFTPLLKIISFSLITRLGSDICQDCGQKACSSVLELVGALCSLAAALPLLERVAVVLMKLG